MLSLYRGFTAVTFVLLLRLLCAPGGAAPGYAAQTQDPLFMSVFRTEGSVAPPGDYRILVGGEGAALHSATKLRPGRPLLVIVDPGSFAREAARERLASLLDNVERVMPQGQPLRFGIAILDGILRDPVVDPAEARRELESVIRSYVPERVEFTGIGPGRFFDIVAGLIERAQEEQGDLDCLLLARDRLIEDEEADYVFRALERRLLHICLRKGSTVYGFMSDKGIWSGLAPATGGEWFDSSAAPAAVVDLIFRNRQNGVRLEFTAAGAGAAAGRLPMTVESASGGGPALQLRSMPSLWRGFGREPPPDYFRIRQALDWRRRSREAEADNNLTVALRFIESSLAEDPWNGDTHFQAGRLAFLLKDTDGAAAFLAQAIRFSPPTAGAVALFAEVGEKLGRSREALQTLQAMRDDGQASGRAILLARARLLVSLDRQAEARALYEELLRAVPAEIRLQGEYGRILWSVGERVLAEKLFNSVIGQDPENLHALTGLSEAALARHDLETASAWAARALQAAPGQPDAFFQAGRVELAAGRTDQALKSLRSAWETAPHRHDILSAFVEAEIGADRFNEARQTLLEAQAAYPASPRVYETLAGLEVRLGNLGPAATVLEAGAALSGTGRAELYRQAAAIRERRGEHGQALLDYRAMLQVADPEDSGSLSARYERHLAYLGLLLGSGDRNADQQPTGDDGESRRQADSNSQAVPAGIPAGGLIIPGGTALLARTAGLNPDQLHGPQAAERLFHFILESMPLAGHKSHDASLRGDLLGYLREYGALVRFLEKRGLIPVATGAPVSFSFPLVGSKPELEPTKRILAFFGVSHRLRMQKTGHTQVELTLKQGRKHSDRQRLLRNLGVNLLDPAIREVRFTIADEDLFLHAGAAAWTGKILDKPDLPPRDLLGQFVKDPVAMQLYVTLAECSEEARAQIVSSSAPGELLRQAEMLRLFAKFLDVHAGRLSFPGDDRAWLRLLASPEPRAPDDLMRLLLHRDQGRTVALYALLGAMPEAARDFLTSTPAMLEEFYRAISANLPKLDDRTSERVWQNATRLAALVEADGQGLYIGVDPKAAQQLLSSWEIPSGGKADSQVLRLEPREFAALLGSAATLSRPTSFPVAEALEFLRQIRREYPGLFADRRVPDLSAAAGLLDLVWDLAPDSELAFHYLEYFRRLAGLRQKDELVNRARTSQALFVLLGAFCRQGTLSPQEGRRLLADLLDQLPADEEAVFAFRVADYLSTRLLPALAAVQGEEIKSGETLLSALSGPKGKHRVPHDGRMFEADLAVHRAARIKQVLLQQHHTPLDILLRIYRELSTLRQAGGERQAIGPVTDAIGLLQVPEFSPGKKKAAESIPAAAVAHLRFMWTEAVQPGRTLPARERERLVKQTAEELHIELGVTLLAYVYAFSSSPENDALAFDPLFVRKHSFGRDGTPGGTEWPAAELRADEKLGSFIAGSLSGLGYELARLETAQAVTGYGTKASGTMLPTMLAGMRAVVPGLRSERAQEYVALTMRLGRKALALSILEAGLRSWTEHRLTLQVSPGRRTAILDFLGIRNLDGALALLSPSELFLLGRDYAATKEFEDPGCPIASRLLELQPTPGSEEDRAFRAEIDQYGILLRKRAGLNQVALTALISYERLAAGAQEGLLSERICDLKFRVAELAHARAIPAPLVELLGESALRDLRPDPGAVGPDNWMLVLDQIAYLGTGHMLAWIEELLDKGLLVPLGENIRDGKEMP